MRKLILQPPRTCNCFHLVLAKFCIFDTCNFLRSLRRLAKGNPIAKAVGLYRLIQERREKTGQMDTLKWRYHFVNGSELIRAFSWLMRVSNSSKGNESP